ncbi:plasmid maintenance system antidote protein [Flavipsychrobacter stenotrophus]|uniref:Plasmid maintenance system antidote protein n=1 Tax=Flavipsychrobacter stenotrophus TaxID=2077091 RepID=A0A2S7SSH4_9BACT|nr:plasmid maintenance system antidote protein [Flavipsychrobacter stenotrophus]PQJ09694.1 plasmid maintenance system antidote protein [Flavipsychrobacter stenotrophus]
MNELNTLKGIHPGFVLEQKLKERKLSKGRFALSINEFPQTIGAITKGKRNMNTPLAMRIEQALGLEEGYFMTLQVYYEIKEEKRKENTKSHPDLTKLRPVLFWDTDMNKIDWIRQEKAAIKRVFERGEKEEKDEIKRFYGEEKVTGILNNLQP